MKISIIDRNRIEIETQLLLGNKNTVYICDDEHIRIIGLPQKSNHIP